LVLCQAINQGGLFWNCEDDQQRSLFESRRHMSATRQIEVQRFSVTSSKPFADVLAVLESTIGHPDGVAFQKSILAAKVFADVETIVNGAVGSSNMLEFARFNIGEILRKERGGTGPRILRLVVGNPLIMKEMVKHVPDAASYAPVTILIDERPDGVHLSYDRMASFISSYGSAEALQVARSLDAKIEAMLTAAA
jgi:hypothetical protein